MLNTSVSWDINAFLAEILYTLGKVAYQSTNLVKLHVSRRKSEILVFDGFLLSKWYQVKTKKGQKSYLSWHWTVMQSLKKNWLGVSNVKFGETLPNHSKVWKFHFDGLFFFPNIQGLSYKNTDKLSCMTMKIDAKFE